MKTKSTFIFKIEKCQIFQAAVVDESDIWLWWKVGNLAMDVVNLRLARFAFEKVKLVRHEVFLLFKKYRISIASDVRCVKFTLIHFCHLVQ